MPTTIDEPTTIAAAQLGDEPAMLQLFDKYDHAMRAEISRRVAVGHDLDDARQDVRELFIRAVQRHDLLACPTLAGRIVSQLRENIARPGDFSMSQATRKRFWSLMRGADYDYDAALALVDAGDAQLSRAAFISAHQTLFTDSLDAVDPITGDTLADRALCSPLTADPQRYASALAALALLEPLQRQVIELQTGLEELRDKRGRKIAPSRVTWKAIADALGVSRRDARTAYDSGIAQLRAVLADER